MPGIGNNLYPPIISTWMPAFVRSSTCNIYFSLSIYNKLTDIMNAQVIVNNQSDNRSALNAVTYPTGIKICEIKTDNDRTDDKYYIQIEPSDLTSGVFGLNQFYKVQIRFTGAGASPMPGTGQIAAWLNDNQQYFSEWSTVCLIKGIEKPNIYLKGFEGSGEELSFTQEIIDLVGNMYYVENAEYEKEALKSYNIMLYDVNTEALVYKSEEVYTNVYNPNEINYTLKTHLENGVKYRLVLKYITTNEYTDSVTYVFSILQNAIDALDATIEAEADIEYGSIKVYIASNAGTAFFGNLTIRRSSSETNYTVWEDIHQEPIAEGKPLNYTWSDYTAESGVFYKYGAQKRNSKGDRGPLTIIKTPVMINLDDMFLTRADMQFRIRFDPSISTFRYIYADSITETLGAKYPYFRRNANVKYRQFPIGGLITAWCDDEGLFISKDNIYKTAKDDYDAYNKEEGITDYNDYIYERKFREKIMEFLYANNVKLFRSPTEGNILVRLMDVSLTPNQTLGRMLYSFTANAYEIDECTIDNYNKYDIQIVGDYSKELTYTYSKLGQIEGEFNGSTDDLFTKVQKKYETTPSEDFDSIVSKITWLRVQCESTPYIIEDISGSPQKATLSISHPFTADMSEGYVMYINKQPMIVSAAGFIEYNDPDTDITSVYFPYETQASFDYIAEIKQVEKGTTSYTKVYFSTKAGQLHGAYEPDADLFREVYALHLADYTSYHQELMSIDKVTVEADPGTVIYVKDSFDDDYYRHEIGNTGVLEFYDDEAVITGLRFAGIHLYPAAGGIIRENNYFNTGVSAASASQVKDPQERGVYTIGGSRMIYYKGDFRAFGVDDIVICPIDTTVDYIYELMKGEY